MFTKIINFLLIYEILTMRSIKRKEGNTKTKINLTKSRNTFKSEIDDELIKMYGRFFVPNKGTFLNFQSKSKKPVNKFTSERDLLPEELIQEYAVIFPESFDFENVGSLVVDEFGNIMELVEVPITNENSVLSLYEDISNDSNASENEFNSFKRIISTEIDQQETLNIFNEPKEILSTDNNDVSKFLLPFTLSESTDEKVLEERWINNFVEDMAFSQEINIDELHTLILNEFHKSSVDFSSSEINADQDVPTDIEKQLLDFNNILEMEPSLNSIKISSKHSIHEKIDAEIIDEILDIYDIQNPVEYSLKHNKFVELNTNENLDYQELSHLQDKNKPNINNPVQQYTEIYKGSLDIPEDIPSTSMPVLNITSFVRTPSSDLPTIVEVPSDVSSLQQSSKVLVTSGVSPRSSEISLQPLPQDFIQRNYSKIFLNIKDIETSSIFAEWQISRLDEINLFIKFVQFSKTKYFDIIKKFFDYLDEELMFILDELKLKRTYQLEKYDPHEYKKFMFTMIESINKANLFSFLMKYRNNHEKNILHILCFEFVQLFNYFPNFPELITLGCLFNQGGDERLILYLRLIHLIINENMNRLNEIRPVVLFLIKKSFVTPDRRCKDINIEVFEKFVISSFYCINSVCEKDHSNFSFFLWEFPPKKLSSMKSEGKVEGGYFYEITKKNVEFFRVVLHSFIFQHIMFTEYHNIAYERYEKLIDKSFKPGECIFCLFEEYLGYLSTDIPENEKE